MSLACSILLTKPKSVPYPVNYETNEDLTWSKTEKGRLCVRFNGLGEHRFQIYCNQRQLKWFQRFYEDQQVKKVSKNQHSSSLFTLRSGRIFWQQGVGKGEPWNVHHLILYCTLDTRLWSEQGTEQVRQEKASVIAKTLTKMNEKGDLNDQQQAFIKRKQSTLTRLHNPFPRPSKPLYQGQPHILVGVALGLEKNEVQIRAEQRVPGYIEGQKLDAKRYRVQVHHWSYGRLIDTIKVQADKLGIIIEQEKQYVHGSLQEQARELAIYAYHSRSYS